MTRSAETRLDGSTLIVRIPMRFQRRGGTQAHRRPRRQRDHAQLEVAARWYTGQGTRAGSRWQKLLDDGVYTTVSEVGDAESISRSYMSTISRSYMSTILQQALLAPDIVEALLEEGRAMRC
jgi:hypothetical protein